MGAGSFPSFSESSMSSPRAPLTTGTTIGGYVIEQTLGHGGMGDVYLARDAAQHRLVALKVLPTDAANDPKRQERLYQEGRVLRSLRHPNICSVYEIGEDNGRTFLAMEYVEGRTLHEVTARERLSVARVMDIACRLASALEAARRAGIVHRDLKGSNVMMLPSGEIKVLDFGLAKFASSSETRLINPISRPTDPGLVFGTAEFMSPEQALGREVDHRSDLFSMGVLLYELLTGRLPFSGSTRMELFWAIVNAPAPSITEANPEASPALVRVVMRLLEKDSRIRYQTADQVLSDLEAARPAQPDVKAQRKSARVRWFHRVAGSGLGIAVALVLLVTFQTLAKMTGDTLETNTLLPSSLWSGTDRLYDMTSVVNRAINPAIIWIGNDGRMIYVTRQSRGRSAIWINAPGQRQPRMIVKDAGPATITRDGRTIFFVRSRGVAGLYRVDVSGEKPVLLVQGPVDQPTVSHDGKTVIFSRRSSGGHTVWGVPGNGGAAYRISTTVLTSVPVVSPDLTRMAIQQTSGVMVCELPACSNPMTLPVTTLIGWTPDSTGLTYQGTPGQSNVWIARVADGKEEQVTRFDQEVVTSVAWSPDGRRLAVTRHRTLGDVEWLKLWR
jgi:serine/threonine protein kinase